MKAILFYINPIFRYNDFMAEGSGSNTIESFTVEKNMSRNTPVSEGGIQFKNLLESRSGLYQSVAQNPRMGFLYECIANDVIKPLPKPKTALWRTADTQEVTIDLEKLNEVTNGVGTVLFSEVERRRQRVKELEQKLPDDTELLRVAKQALVDAIDITLRTGLFDRKALSDATYLTSPRNIVISNEEDSSQDMTQYFASLQAQGIDTKGWSNTPLPEDKRTKDGLVALNVAKFTLAHVSDEYLAAAQEHGIAMTEEQALQIAMVETVAHEHCGHSVDVAQYMLKKTGSFTQAYDDLSDRYGNYNFTQNELHTIHSELFARGVGQFVISRFLSEKYGYSDDTIRKLLRRQRETSNMEAVRGLFPLLKQDSKVDSMQELVGMDRKLNKAIIENLTGDNMASDKTAWSISEVVAYADTPYTEGEIKKYFHTSN